MQVKLETVAVRIDSHNHFWRYQGAEYPWIDPTSRLACDYAPAELSPLLQQASIDAAIAIQARQSETETDWLLELSETHAWIAGVVGWADLRSRDIEGRLDSYAGKSKLVGFRHVIQDEPEDTFMLDEAFVRGVRAVLERDWTYDILIRGSQARSAAQFIERAGPGRFVLDHCAKPPVRDGVWEPWASDMRLLSQHPNLYCKLSGLVTEAENRGWRADDLERYLAHVLDTFGPQRVMFGSDWPVCLLAASYHAVVELVESFVRRHCPGDEAAIFGNTAKRAYRLREEV